MLSSREFQRSMHKLLADAPMEFSRQQGTYRVAECDKQESAIAASAFRAQMATLLDSLDAGGCPIVLVHRKGMGKIQTFYKVERV